MSLLGGSLCFLQGSEKPSHKKYTFRCNTILREFDLATAILVASTISFRTLLCRHVYRPLSRAYLQFESTWWSVWEIRRRAHIYSLTSNPTRSLSISLLLSWIISSALTAEQDSDHFAKWFQPTAWRPVWIGPRISSHKFRNWLIDLILCVKLPFCS